MPTQRKPDGHPPTISKEFAMKTYYTVYDPPIQQTHRYNWTSNQMNLYFPDHWTENVADEFEYLQGTGRAFPTSFAGYCTGLVLVDIHAYGYATMRALINLGVLDSYNDVPAWVYIYPAWTHYYPQFPRAEHQGSPNK